MLARVRPQAKVVAASIREHVPMLVMLRFAARSWVIRTRFYLAYRRLTLDAEVVEHSGILGLGWTGVADALTLDARLGENLAFPVTSLQV